MKVADSMEAQDSFETPTAVTRGPAHHFFGYYEKTPWDATGRYLLAMQTTFIDRPPTPDDVAAIGLIDAAEGNAWQPIAETTAWNWQQGAMLQWLPSARDRLVIYNVRRSGGYASVVHDVWSGETRELPRPVYAISPDGRTAFSLDFERIADTRPGYGYVGFPDPHGDDPCPETEGVYRMDLRSGESRLIVSLHDIAHYRPDEGALGAKHWFNHVQVNTDGSRIAFLHRWDPGEQRVTRCFTADPDGSDVYLLAGDGMTSHYDWRDPTHVLAWARHHGVGDRYFLMTDRTQEKQVVGEGTLTTDGHCSYSPDRRWILTDTYPDDEHKRTLLLYDPAEDRRVDLGGFYAPPELPGEIRCDLHPRWSRDGRRVCFDSAHEGMRQMYVLDVSRIVQD